MAKYKVYTLIKPMKNLTKLAEWQALAKHQRTITNQHMRDWFRDDTGRFSQFSIKSGELFLDYSRNRIHAETIQLLCNLAHAMDLPQKIDALFHGQPINTTEKRAVLHAALRDKNHVPIMINGENIAPLITKTQEKMREFVANIHAQTWRGVTGKPITHIVNIGIGGSHFGPLMGTQALKDFAITNLQFHFISSVDKAPLNDILQYIDPETTLFIISSKSFTTIENHD